MPWRFPLEWTASKSPHTDGYVAQNHIEKNTLPYIHILYILLSLMPLNFTSAPKKS